MSETPELRAAAASMRAPNTPSLTRTSGRAIIGVVLATA
jgi:hypothetical protein